MAETHAMMLVQNFIKLSIRWVIVLTEEKINDEASLEIYQI